MENIAIKIGPWFDRNDWVQNEPRQLHKNFKFQRQTKNIRKCQETEGYYFFINENKYPQKSSRRSYLFSLVRVP